LSLRAIGHSKDFWSGVLFIAFGICAIVFGRQHPIGTTMRMGPGAFPVLLGGISVAIGAVLAIRAFVHAGPPVERITFLRPGLVLASVVTFGFVLEFLGLVAATAVLVVMSALASRKFHAPTALALGIGLGVGSAAVFVWALGLPIPIVGRWLGG
jgi:hypothetical protein